MIPMSAFLGQNGGTEALQLQYKNDHLLYIVIIIT